ncbi:MAG: T9SS type A sorting domain-containing protein [Crocinitomicaceae bacterium]|nr:T9SS type A sorting domain-containing protein [Crocinitomicaceae bacterium]
MTIFGSVEEILILHVVVTKKHTARFYCKFFRINSFGQSDLVNQPLPFLYKPQARYTLESGIQFNQPEYYNHPDFGRLTFSAPYGKNVVEDLSKRTLDERYYVDLDDQNFFYVEKSSRPINFYKDGLLIAIDPSLHKVNDTYYESGAQPVPTALDLLNKKVILKIGGQEFSFSHLTLELTDFSNQVSLVEANWSNIVVGNFGAYITDLFPGIDYMITFKEGAFKTEFTIKQNLNVKNLRFIDALEMPDHYVAAMDGNGIDSSFVQLINTQTATTDLVIRPARSRDASGVRTAFVNPFLLDENSLSILCDSTLLNGGGVIYPIVVDPLFIAVGPVTSALGIRGSLLTPAFCSHSLVVNFPAGSTPWDVSANWSVFADFCVATNFDCWRSEAQVWLTSGCGGASPVGAPGIIWSCFPGCNSWGTWAPTVPFSGSGMQSLAQCYAPSCFNQNLTFTINDNRVYCNTYLGTYDNCTWANSYCVSLNQWSVTVQGRSVETLGNSATGNGNTTFNDPDCIGTTLLNPTPLYGVPGYTYNWSTGATSPTITVGVSPAVYTCTVTDACGTSVVATFNIGCPLPVRLNSFAAILSGDIALINWETLSESGIEKFSLEKADESGNFQSIAVFDASGNSNGSTYDFKDLAPYDGITYYRLAIIFEGGEIEYSELASVTQKTDVIQIDPNPNNGVFTVSINTPTEEEILFEVYNSTGVMIYSEVLKSEGSLTKHILDLSDQAQGVYTIRVLSSGKSRTEKLIIR